MKVTLGHTVIDQESTIFGGFLALGEGSLSWCIQLETATDMTMATQQVDIEVRQDMREQF